MDSAQRQRYAEDIRAEIARLAGLIDAPANMVPSLESAEGGTWLSVDWHDADDGDDEVGWRLALNRNEGGYDWVISEVGVGYEDYLLYVLFEEATAEIAKRQVTTLDRTTRRRAWFSLQESMLTKLKKEWGETAAAHHARILVRDHG
jgi:hypothetical protein